MCNKSEMGKALKWLFEALEKARNATMEKNKIQQPFKMQRKIWTQKVKGSN
jgi:hypothetical protein